MPKLKKVATEMNGTEFAMMPLSLDEIKTASKYTREEIAAVVSLYNNLQKLRVGASNKASAHKRMTDKLSDPAIVLSLKANLAILERQAVRPMASYVQAQPLGRWAIQMAGVDTVICAGMLAHIDLMACACRQYDGTPRHDRPKHDCPGQVTAGGIWKFAGLIDPKDLVWEKGMRRPYNARLKTLCWQLGECFKRAGVTDATEEQVEELIRKKHEKAGESLMARELNKLVMAKMDKIEKRRDKLQGEEYLYVRLYKQRKKLEIERNEKGLFADQAHVRLAECRRLKRMISPEQKTIWSSGKLQPKGLDLRAMRYAVKIFISHWHQVGRTMLGMPLVKPWAIEHGGHCHYIAPPLFDGKVK